MVDFDHFNRFASVVEVVDAVHFGRRAAEETRLKADHGRRLVTIATVHVELDKTVDVFKFVRLLRPPSAIVAVGIIVAAVYGRGLFGRFFAQTERVKPVYDSNAKVSRRLGVVGHRRCVVLIDGIAARV